MTKKDARDGWGIIMRPRVGVPWGPVTFCKQMKSDAITAFNQSFGVEAYAIQFKRRTAKAIRVKLRGFA